MFEKLSRTAKAAVFGIGVSLGMTAIASAMPIEAPGSPSAATSNVITVGNENELTLPIYGRNSPGNGGTIQLPSGYDGGGNYGGSNREFYGRNRSYGGDRHYGRERSYGGNRYYGRDRYYERDRSYYGRGYRRGFRNYGLGTGLVFGLGIPAYGYDEPRYYAPRRTYRNGAVANSRVQWCYDTYRSYRASDNTYQPSNGRRQQCRAPF